MKHNKFNGSIENNDLTLLYKKLSVDVSDPLILTQLESALNYVLKVHDPIDLRPSSLDISVTLKHLGVDTQMLIAALLSDPRLRGSLDTLTIEQKFNIVSSLT